MSPDRIAEKGEKIYRDKYQNEYEGRFRGKLVAISLETENAYMGASPVEALQAAKQAEPNAYFHLIKVGAPGVYTFAYSSPSRGHRVFWR